MKEFLKIIDPFNENQLQLIVLFLRRVKDSGMSVDEYLATFYRLEEKKKVDIKEQHRAFLLENKKTYKQNENICPECGNKMSRVSTGSNQIKVVGCKRCRYSMIKG